MAWETAIGSFSAFVVLAIAAGILGADSAGALRGVGTLFGPLNTVMAAASFALVPEVTRLGDRAVRMVVICVVALFVIALIWGGVLIVLPDELGSQVLGATWPVVAPLLPVGTVEYSAVGVWIGLMVLIRVSGGTRRSLELRVLHAVVSVCLASAAASFLGQTFFVSCALAASAVVLAAGAALSARALPATFTSPGRPSDRTLEA